MNNQSLQTRGASLDDTLLSNFKVVIPEAIRFRQSKSALAAKRVPVKIRAENQTYSSNNNRQIRIMFPNNTLYDTRYGFLTFDLSITTTGGTYKRMANGIFSAFDRLHIIYNSTEVDDLRDYNRIQNVIWYSSIDPDVTANIAQMPINGTSGGMGLGTQAERNVVGSGTTSYACPLYSGILNTELLPVQDISGGMIIELYIGDPTSYVETDGTNPQVTISNVLFYVERLELDSDYMSFIKGYIATNGLQMGFCTFERYINSLTTGAQQNLTINNKNSSVDSFYNLFLNSATISTTTVNDKFQIWTNPGLTQYNMLVNGTIYPDEPIDTLTNGAYQAFQIYCRNQGKWALNVMIPLKPPIPFQFFNSDSFLFIVDMQPYPEDASQGLINPFTTLGNNATIILKLVFAGVIAANLQCDTWVRFFRQVAIRRNGSVQVLQ